MNGDNISYDSNEPVEPYSPAHKLVHFYLNELVEYIEAVRYRNELTERELINGILDKIEELKGNR